MAPVHKQANRPSDLERMDDEGGWHEAQWARDEEADGGELGGYGESGSAPMRRTGRKRARDRDGVRRSRAKRDREH